MPIYAYRCAECGHDHEALQKFSDAPLTDCPACGEPALQKQVTAAGFRLKGTGWYVTDFRDGGKPAAQSAGSSAESAESAKPSTATESAAPAKPATP